MEKQYIKMNIMIIMIIIIIVTVLQRIYNTLYTSIYHSGTRNNKDDEQPKQFELEYFETKQIYIWEIENHSYKYIFRMSSLIEWHFVKNAGRCFFPIFPYRTQNEWSRVKREILILIVTLIMIIIIIAARMMIRRKEKSIFKFLLGKNSYANHSGK